MSTFANRPSLALLVIDAPGGTAGVVDAADVAFA